MTTSPFVSQNGRNSSSVQSLARSGRDADAESIPSAARRRTSHHIEITPPQQTVRFSSKNQEIEPDSLLEQSLTLTRTESPRDSLSPRAKEELQNLAVTLQKSRLQQHRMSNFAFEPMSLPSSRAHSRSTSPARPSNLRHSSGTSSASSSTLMRDVHSPPLTPAESDSNKKKLDACRDNGIVVPKVRQEHAVMTPQSSQPHASYTLDSTTLDENNKDPSNAMTSRPSTSSGQISTRPTSLSENTSDVLEMKSKRPPKFVLGSPSDSPSVSKESSPVSTPRADSSHGNSSPVFTHVPFAPAGDANDPYARHRRPPQNRNLNNVDARFVFNPKDRRRSGFLGSAIANAAIPRSRSGTDLHASQKRGSGFFRNDDAATGMLERPHGSMAELKRFFRLGKQGKRSQSPSPSMMSGKSGRSGRSMRSSRSGTKTPPHQLAPPNVPFADDHGLESRYGKFGKVLGSGAGGSVRIIKRQSDGITFAVKQFRDRHPWETEREYSKKVTAEFCIGSTLHHGNVVETLDIIHEKGRWFEVMEYAPFDLFAAVMTGKMTREEVTCTFLQILSGVSYLHSMGLAHRDLKLDNVVVSADGIMKIIDFGSASVFRYPFENDIVKATGIVGSDPYLAPEVYDQKYYDPQCVDIWSLAIIYCCMTLRRFPWKMPRLSDHSYKLFVSSPTPGTPVIDPIARKAHIQTFSKSLDDTHDHSPSEPVSRNNSDDTEDPAHRRHRHRDRKPAGAKSEPVSRTDDNPPKENDGIRHESSTHKSSQTRSDGKSEVIKGPWRLLRLLPRESRYVIAGMLKVDPNGRMKLGEILKDPWIALSPVCRQDEDGKVYKASAHTHTLEPGSAATPVADKDKR